MNQKVGGLVLLLILQFLASAHASTRPESSVQTTLLPKLDSEFEGFLEQPVRKVISHELGQLRKDLTDLRYIMQAGMETIPDKVKRKAFFDAARNGKVGPVRGFLQAGLSVDERDPSDLESTALHIAARSGQKYVVEALLANNANVDAPGTENKTPLFEAAGKGHVEVVRLLLGAGADVNATSTRRVTPLIQALKEGQPGSAKVLLDAKSWVNAADRQGWSPLHWAISNRLSFIADLLIAAGANVNHANNYLWTPVHSAVAINLPSTLKLLIQTKANVNAVNNGGDTPLGIAVKDGNEELSQILIDAGADVNAVDTEGSTVLHRAASTGSRRALVELLLKVGAKKLVRNSEGKTPADIARERGNQELVQVLAA